MTAIYKTWDFREKNKKFSREARGFLGIEKRGYYFSWRDAYLSEMEIIMYFR